MFIPANEVTKYFSTLRNTT